MIFARLRFKLKERKSLRCKRAFFFCALFLFSFSLFSFSAAVEQRRPEANSVYRAVSPQKSLTSSPQFILIDDFNLPEWKNKRDGIWHLRNASSKEVKIKRVREDARNPQFGSSLEILFNLARGREMVFSSSLKKLDVSQADLLVFSCKFLPEKGRPFAGSLRVVLEDWRAKSAVVDITNACAGDQAWGEITLKRESFRNLDWDQLNSIAFLLVSGGEPARGKFQIDEIAFYGINDIFFESNADNLKSFPRRIFEEARRAELQAIKNDKTLLREIATDTWKYFEAAHNPQNGMVVDHLRVGDAPLASNYTSPTNIAMDLMAVIAAEKLSLISRAEAFRKVSQKLKTIDQLRQWNDLYYNFYETTKLSVTRGFVSSVDNGWLGIALVVTRQAFDREFYREATKILNRMDFGEFLDYNNNQLSLGFDSERNELISTHYGMLVSEARATSLLGIGKGDLPEDHWWSLYRTPPTAWTWQSQKPKGHQVDTPDAHYFQGYYLYGETPIVPSWGGSLFEVLMPTLVLSESENAPHSFGPNNLRTVKAHKDYALNKKEYPIWGLSPAATTDGRQWKYGEYGVKELGVKGYPDHGVVTPHVSFLALDAAPEEAIENIRKMLEIKMYGEYGFYDSIQVKTGRVNTQYLALDQGMSFLALANYLEGRFLQKLFSQDEIGQKAEQVWTKEKFFE